LSIEKFRDVTIVFLIKKNKGKISEVCLAMKKRGFGINKWNGVGGKVGDKIEETIEQGARREAQEEIGVYVLDLQKVAELTFTCPDNTDWNQLTHVYLTENWDNEPSESEEMKPQWFNVDEIPYDLMWDGDELWLPTVLNGEFVKGTLEFGGNNTLQGHEIEIVTDFTKSIQ